VTGFIYGLVDPRDGTIRYVGKGYDPKARTKQHLKASHNPRVNKWVSELREIGLRPKLKILVKLRWDRQGILNTHDPSESTEKFVIHAIARHNRRYSLPDLLNDSHNPYVSRKKLPKATA
jgi:hypothetical protein